MRKHLRGDLVKTAVVILSLNAGEYFEKVLQSHALQSFVPDARLLIDSGSSDGTVERAEKFNWEIRRIEKRSFNHGMTRQQAAEHFFALGFECIIMCTQDVLLAEETTLQVLVDALQENQAAAAYARQMPLNEKNIDGFSRLRNYPPHSRVKSREDIPELGLMTPFCSDSLAVWDLQKIMAAGGFPETEFGEDMLLGAELILKGEKIVYCAESRCIHEHNSSFSELFSRGVGIGTLHGAHPELRKRFGSVGKCASKQLKLSEMLRFFLPLAVKYAGMLRGYWGKKLKI